MEAWKPGFSPLVSEKQIKFRGFVPNKDLQLEARFFLLVCGKIWKCIGVVPNEDLTIGSPIFPAG